MLFIVITMNDYSMVGRITEIANPLLANSDNGFFIFSLYMACFPSVDDVHHVAVAVGAFEKLAALPGTPF